ncbi:Low temperature viability protein [Wolfiporia cocos MD-104 SS10]|uniref:Low temperature viability protein n=1 Tax=Wolfiporia cocos (strain MD-104) TaxID=742152 RepID=A0A2H3JDU4_WOLCO|nr:Low temperature viability protein [Wolfiporia cocos MD-104 SS10]
MPPKSKSIYRQPGARHFQLVHRSQRDPLINDPEASQRVLKEFERGNAAKGKSRAELERLISPSDLAHDSERANIGEAALYGVYYDDTKYDYMQHLRPVGVQEVGVDSILIEAPVKKGKGKAKEPIQLLDLPPEVLPSAEVPRNYEAQENIPSSIAGFQPDMDPHLRQTLEALEDDAFVDDDLEDDFFGALVAEGERAPNERLEFEFQDEGFDDEELEQNAEPSGDGEELSWEERFAQFKKAQKAAAKSDGSDVDTYSEGRDTIGELPQFSVIGGKKRRKGSSDASGYSMSSSSMFRNEGLTTIDEQFDEIQKEYESDEDEAETSDNDDEAPELITSREDFDAIMNDFLDNYEIVGGKMRRVLAGETATEKLDTIRKSLGAVHLREDDDDEKDLMFMPLDVDEKQERWDCETILTTYSNLENHPRLIRARQEKPIPKIRLDPKTGMPIVDGNAPASRRNNLPSDTESDEEPQSSFTERVTIARSKDESKEEKKARKQAVKAERQQRRAVKKANKDQFSTEAQRHDRSLANKEKTRARKL